MDSDGLLDPMDEILDAYSPGVEATAMATQPPKAQPRTGSFLFGVLLVGLGSTAAMAAQTGLSLAQSASIWLLVCAATTLAFLVIRVARR